MKNNEYKITKENGEVVATYLKNEHIIGVGDTEEEAISELKIFVEEYENYMKNQKKEPLKSFEIIKKMYVYFVKHFRTLEPKLMICEKEDFDNVEITLKDYEKKTKLAKEYVDVNNVAKRLKALEIIRIKAPNVFWIMRTKTYKEYTIKVRDDTLLQKEYYFLKEVLK